MVSITVGTSDPLLSISVQTPPQLAGLSVTVGYDAAIVDLPAGAVELLGEFAAADCLSVVDDDDVGEVQFEARISKPGRTLVFGEVELYLPDGKRAAHATSTYMWLPDLTG